MNYYALDQDRTYSTWVAMLLLTDEKRLKLNENIRSREFWNLPTTIPLWMHTKDLLTSTVRYADVHEWPHDLSVGAVPSPHGNILIISSKVKKVLEEFSLPDHRYYDVKLSNRYNDNDPDQSYYLLHIRYERYEKLVYPKVTFGVFRDALTSRQMLVKTFEEGFIKNLSEYEALASSIWKEDDVSLMPTTNVYEDKWDILWGRGGCIIVSEAVKERLLQTGAKGIKFVPHKVDFLFLE